MPEDLKFPFEYDESGDAATVVGEDFYYQHALMLCLIVAHDNVRGSPLTETDLIEIRDSVGDTISNSPYFDDPVDVEVTESSTETFTAEIDANNVTQFEITV